MWYVKVYTRGFNVENFTKFQYVEDEHEVDAYDIRAVIGAFVPEFETFESAYAYAEKYAWTDLRKFSFMFDEGTDAPVFNEKTNSFEYDNWDNGWSGDHVRITITCGGS